MVRVVELDLDLELEAVWLRHGAQRLQGHRGQVEGEVKSLHRVPGHRQVVGLHPLLAGVEGLGLLLAEVDAVGVPVVVDDKVQIFADVAVSVVLHTELQAGVAEEWTQGVGFNLLPVLDHEVKEIEELPAPVDCQLARGWGVGVYLPNLVPVSAEKIVNSTYSFSEGSPPLTV